jgi:acyl-coenzyme A synthetase/AMP-(fatty) acid ligase
MDNLSAGGIILLAVSALLAGGINAVAGGGSLITFPTLLALGFPPVTANVTNTVGLVPGYLGGIAGYRKELEGQRAFRTQDLGYIDEAGNLFIVGRMGSTVKVAGYRIDLGEVETIATSLPGVHLACGFIFDAGEGHQELWLAIESKDRGVALDIFSIKKGFRAALPNYMVPKRIFVLEDLPRNANAKIDREAIRQMVGNEVRAFAE